MEYKFSDRVLTLKPSAIREIFKYAADPSYISLSAGNPAPEAFPSKQLAAISAKLMEEEPILALQYSTTEGYPPLLQHLKAYMKSSRNIGTEDDGVLVTSGAQQIMDLFTKSILNEGETVICEAPSFIGSLNDFRSYKAKLVGIPMDTDGMNMEALEKALETEKNVKFIYTIPNFQNPSGITMSLEKRHRLYELAKAHDVMILEDNPYGDLYYEGEPLPSIKSFDTDGIVIYAGSLVNSALLDATKPGCEIHDSAKMTLAETTAVIVRAEAEGKTTVRLHTGDSSIYGAVREQFDELIPLGIEYDVTPGVSAFCGAAASLKQEFTLPEVSQTVIITRQSGKTLVPEKESIRSLAAHRATMCLYLSTRLTKELQQELLEGGYPGSTPVAIVFKASWPDERIFHCTVDTLHKTVTENDLTRTSLIIVGDCMGEKYAKSYLYDPSYDRPFHEAATK